MLHPWCDRADADLSDDECKCGNAFGAKSCTAQMDSMVANTCGLVRGIDNPGCLCGGDETASSSSGACDESSLMPNCLTTTKTFEVGNAGSTCQKCQKTLGSAGDGDGSTQGTCPAEKKCYLDGSCKGKCYVVYKNNLVCYASHVNKNPPDTELFN